MGRGEAAGGRGRCAARARCLSTQAGGAEHEVAGPSRSRTARGDWEHRRAVKTQAGCLLHKEGRKEKKEKKEKKQAGRLLHKKRKKRKKKKKKKKKGKKRQKEKKG